ncbi:hypothetical protein [Ottowia testudinis]|uniref:Protease inhibitor Inh n=1 Tax=Ottowia testudinis TaxID=2816950 RepID=A0A975CID2_9BURK|nr:hypothetical protein [Ottowia testudinis]QTD45641.1 hypothetical protein J1M35_01570 [Ottowia testudinis]
MSIARKQLAAAALMLAGASAALAAGPAPEQAFAGTWRHSSGGHTMEWLIQPGGQAQLTISGEKDAYRWRAEGGGAWLVLTSTHSPAIACLRGGKLQVYFTEDNAVAATLAAAQKAGCGADAQGESAIELKRV